MHINSRELRQYYSSLADEELLTINRDELTRGAQLAYDEEIARRGLNEQVAAAEPMPGVDLKPDWQENSVCICSFVDAPRGTAAEKIAKSQAALEAAGIPSELKVTEDEQSGNDDVGVMVPTIFAPHAASILDRDLFNEEYEAEWRAQLEMLPDEALMALDPKIFCAGLLDRVERIKRGYRDEMQRRKLPPRTE